MSSSQRFWRILPDPPSNVEVACVPHLTLLLTLPTYSTTHFIKEGSSLGPDTWGHGNWMIPNTITASIVSSMANYFQLQIHIYIHMNYKVDFWGCFTDFQNWHDKNHRLSASQIRKFHFFAALSSAKCCHRGGIFKNFLFFSSGRKVIFSMRLQYKSPTWTTVQKDLAVTIFVYYLQICLKDVLYLCRTSMQFDSQLHNQVVQSTQCGTWTTVRGIKLHMIFNGEKCMTPCR